VWETQPSVRKVVDFIARALASTPLKVYRRASDTDRPRVTDHPLARVLNSPRDRVTAFRFWYDIVADWMIFDRYCALKTTSLDRARGLDLTRVQAARVQFGDDGLGNVTAIWVDGRQELSAAACIFDHGYSPLGANGTTPMRTLGAILQENAESVAYRRGVWQRGARVPTVLQRPATAPQWSPEARARFAAGWQRYSRSGGSEGGTPILEDGMSLVKAEAFSPRDAEDLSGRQLADAEVASAFQIAPELVGARQGTYSNVDAFRQMKYRDSLGPYYIAWEQTLNAMLTPDLDPTGELYIEADLDAKLRGSFDEQAQILSTSVGAPWLTRDEARARQNLPAIAGGSDLVTPLNVLVGGQASPRDSGSQNVGKVGSVALKARAGSTYEKRAEQVMAAFFTAQRDEVVAALASKAAADWWDGERYDQQLADSLFALAVLVADEIGKQAAESLGYRPATTTPPAQWRS
jgi:HK97 family phage portal protein